MSNAAIVAAARNEHMHYVHVCLDGPEGSPYSGHNRLSIKALLQIVFCAFRPLFVAPMVNIITT